MKIKKVNIKNFRLLEDFKLDFKEDLSLIVGKNNCGKTSLITIMDKFLGDGEPNFSWNDFSLDFQTSFYEKIQKSNDDSEGEISDDFSADVVGIQMQLFIEYNDKDNLLNIQNFIMDLNPDNNIVVLEFIYTPTKKLFEKLKEDLKLPTRPIIDIDAFSRYMVRNSSRYFKLRRYARGFDVRTKEINGDTSDDLKFSEIHKLINLKTIMANRPVSNKSNNHILSGLSQNYYNIIKENNDNDVDLSPLEEAIEKADTSLNQAYNGGGKQPGIFENIFNIIKTFGTDSVVKIQSSMSETELLKNNTTLYYDSEGSLLPESYNGLGYLNLMGMIFEVEIIIAEFLGKVDEEPSDINVLFIEEPEAHTHPQLQYIFIRNIKKLIEKRQTEDGKKLNIQTAITTHSSHIVSESDFDDVRYFVRENNRVKAKNFEEELRDKYSSKPDAFHFVKKYLNLSRSDLFFTDKAIFIEGDTERILLPAMMKKIDDKNILRNKSNSLLYQYIVRNNYIPLLSENILKNKYIPLPSQNILRDKYIPLLAQSVLRNKFIPVLSENILRNKYITPLSENILRNIYIPLLSQNISIVEVGAYSHIFKELIDFLGIKVLVITDIDLAKNVRKKNKVGKKVWTKVSCSSTEYPKYTFNKSLIKFFDLQSDNTQFQKLTKKNGDEKVNNGCRVAYQIKENKYQATSFEDAFICTNFDFIKENKANFSQGLKNREKFDNDPNYYELAQNCIKKKSAFASELLYYDKPDENNTWKVPKYIEEGLVWLQKV